MWRRILAGPKDNHLVSDSMTVVADVVVRVTTVSDDDLMSLSAVGSMNM